MDQENVSNQLNLRILYNVDDEKHQFRVIFNPSVGAVPKPEVDAPVSKRFFDDLQREVNAVYAFWKPEDLGRVKGGANSADLIEIANKIPGDTTLEKLETIGNDIYEKLFPDKLKNYLREGSVKSVVIESSDFLIPFELMHDGEDFLSKKIAFYRKPIIEHQKDWRIPEKIKRERLTVAFFTNPTNDLKNAEDEVKKIMNYF